MQRKVPQKQLIKEDIKELNLPTNEDVPIVPQQSLTTEDIQQMALSMDVLIFAALWHFVCTQEYIIVR